MSINPATCLWLLFALTWLCRTQPSGRLCLFPTSSSRDLRISPFLCGAETLGSLYLLLKIWWKGHGLVDSARLLVVFKVSP